MPGILSSAPNPVTKGNFAPLIRPPGSFATPPILRGRHRHRAGTLILAPHAAGHRRSYPPLPIVTLTRSSLRRRRMPHGSWRGGHDTAAPLRPCHGDRPRRGMLGCWQQLGRSTVWPSLGVAMWGSRRRWNQLRRDKGAGMRQRRQCWSKLHRSFKDE